MAAQYFWGGIDATVKKLKDTLIAYLSCVTERTNIISLYLCSNDTKVEHCLLNNQYLVLKYAGFSLRVFDSNTIEVSPV